MRSEAWISSSKYFFCVESNDSESLFFFNEVGGWDREALSHLHLICWNSLLVVSSLSSSLNDNFQGLLLLCAIQGTQERYLKTRTLRTAGLWDLTLWNYHFEIKMKVKKICSSTQNYQCQEDYWTTCCIIQVICLILIYVVWHRFFYQIFNYNFFVIFNVILIGSGQDNTWCSHTRETWKVYEFTYLGKMEIFSYFNAFDCGKGLCGFITMRDSYIILISYTVHLIFMASKKSKENQNKLALIFSKIPTGDAYRR